MRKGFIVSLLLMGIFLSSYAYPQGGTGIGQNYTTYKQRSSAPATPPSTYSRLYFKTDGKLYHVNSAGTEAVAGNITADPIWDAAGDTIYGTGADTATRLAKGTAYQLYMMNSGATAPAWTSTLGATGARLTAGFFTDLTVTNAIAGSTTGNIANTLADAAGDLIQGSADNTWAKLTAGAVGSFLMSNGTGSALSYLTAGAANQILIGQGVTTAPQWSSTLSIATLDLTSGTSSIPFIVATDCSAVVAEGSSCWDSDDNVLYIGNTTTQSAIAKVGGALGTPSFTALNMPSSNADPGTTAGQIKHDSTDTASNSGGTAKWYDGAQVRSLVDTGTNYTIITKEEYLPIRYAEDDDSVAAPAAAAEIGTTSLIARSFAEDADNGVVFFWKVPNDYVGGIKFRVIYATDTNASADETVAFGLSGCSIGHSDAIACSEGTAVNVTQELTTDEDTSELLITAYSTEVTVTNIAAGEVAKLLLIRDVSEDDAAGHMLVVGIDIKYKAKIIGFDGY